ncbi:MAG TPA: class I SAM-dependent methyltransferase [Vicinamibacterales bacterium]|nr:class I SAM-dependent methyltransferase [Vicinamibacterales bacterium]
MTLEAEFGQIDIYLFDQILRGRIIPRDRILDAGCGSGRNLVYLVRQGAVVYGVDGDPEAIREVRSLAAKLAPSLPAENFRVEAIQRTSFPDGFATVVVSSAVLHFARDDAEFEAMLEGTWRVLASGGLFFCRLASTIGFETRVRRVDGAGGGAGWSGRGRYQLPDGTTRYLIDENYLVDRTRTLGGKLMDPIKTTVVQDQRSMTTWVVRKD